MQVSTKFVAGVIMAGFGAFVLYGVLYLLVSVGLL